VSSTAKSGSASGATESPGGPESAGEQAPA